MQTMFEHQPTPYDLLVKRLAVEAVSIPNVVDVFRELIPQSADLIRNNLPGLSNFWGKNGDQYHPKNSVFRDVLRQASQFSYIAYEDTLVQVPEGFIGKPIAYAQELNRVGQGLIVEGQKLLNDYVTVLSRFLSSKEARVSALNAHTSLYIKAELQRNMAQRAISGYFKSGSTLSRRRLGTLIDRFSDLQHWFKETENLDVTRNQQSFKSVEAKVKESVDLLDLIAQRSAEESVNQVSGDVAKALAKGAYEVAKFVEFLVIYNYQAESMVVTTNNVAEQLNAIFSSKN